MSDRYRVVATAALTFMVLLFVGWVAYLVYLQPSTVCTTFQVVTKAPLW